MSYLKILLAALVLVAVTNPLVAEPPGQADDYRKMVDTFFESIGKEEFGKAISELISTNPAYRGSSMDEGKIKAKLQLIEMGKSAGKFINFEVITDQKVGKKNAYIFGFAIWEN